VSPRLSPLAGIGLVLLCWVASPARADESFWKSLGRKFAGDRPVIGLLNECTDYVTYTGEVEIRDVTQQSGLETTKSAAAFKGSRFSLESRYHWMTAVLDGERAADLSTVRIPFNSKRTLFDVEARVIRADGTPMPVPGDRIVDEPMAPGLPAYADLRWRVVNFGQLPDSCVIDLKYGMRSSEEFAANHFVFDHPFPTDVQRYTISVPVSVVAGFSSWWTQSFKGYNEIPKSDNVTVSGSTGELQRYVWELEGVPETPKESLARPLTSVARSVDLTVAFDRDWDKMLTWYRGDVEKVFTDDARGGEMAREIVRGIDDDSLKARALYAHVQRHVRWVPIPFNRTTLVPDPPSEVLERAYGDAKDMAACLAFLLRSAGLQAHMALVSTGPPNRFDKYFPTWLSFDHAVVRLVLPSGGIWLDPTDPVLGFGMLPETIQGGHWDEDATPFLVWDGSPNFWKSEGGPPITIPRYGYQDCGYGLSEPQIVWDRSGTVQYRATLDMRGALSLGFRRKLLGKPPEEQKAAFAEWLNRGGGKENVVELEAPNLENLDEPLRLRYAVSRPWTPGEEEVRLPSRFFGLPFLQEIPAEPKRATPVAFTYPLDIQESVSVPPPEGYALASFPTNAEYTAGFFRFDRQYTDVSGNLQISSTLAVNEESVDVNRYGQFLSMLEGIGKLGDEEIVFRKTPLVGRAAK
jgi:transglutaminase-like putative cysteine protease